MYAQEHVSIYHVAALFRLPSNGTRPSLGRSPSKSEPFQSFRRTLIIWEKQTEPCWHQGFTRDDDRTRTSKGWSPERGASDNGGASGC